MWFPQEVQGECGPLAALKGGQGWHIFFLPPGLAGMPFSRLVWHPCTGPWAAVWKEKHPGPHHRSLGEPQEMSSLAYGAGYMVLVGSCQVKKILVQARKIRVSGVLRGGQRIHTTPAEPGHCHQPA